MGSTLTTARRNPLASVVATSRSTGAARRRREWLPDHAAGSEQCDRPGPTRQAHGCGADDVRRAQPALARRSRSGACGRPVRRRADDLDGEDRRWLPAVLPGRVGQPGRRPRRARARRLLFGRHRRHGRALAAGDGRRGHRSFRRGRRGNDDDADRGRRHRRRRAEPPLRPAPVELLADRHGCQPVGDPSQPRRYRPAEDPRQQLVLPRQRRRDA